MQLERNGAELIILPEKDPDLHHKQKLLGREGRCSKSLIFIFANYLYLMLSFKHNTYTVGIEKHELIKVDFKVKRQKY